MEMNLLLYLIATAYFCLIEVSCRSIYIDSDFLSGIEMNKVKSITQEQENRGKISWKKLKPILRRDMQRIQTVNGMEAINAKEEFTENTHVIQPINKENFTKIAFKEDLSFNEKQQMINNIFKSDLAVNNQTVETGKFISNVTHTKMLTLDPTSTAKDFPYNITPDVLTQDGDLIVFLALNETVESEGTSLLHEGTIVPLQEIASTGNELLTVFQKRENTIQTEIPTLQKNIKDENNFTALNNEDFTVSTFTLNHSRKKQLEEISTEDKTVLSGNNDISTDIFGIQNTELNNLNSYESDKLKGVFNTDYTVKQLNGDGNELQSIKSEEIPFFKERTELALRELSSTENGFVKSFETKQNLNLTELTTFQPSQKHDSNFTELTSGVYLNVSNFSFNYSRDNEQQKIETNKLNSNISDIVKINSDRFESVNNKLSSFQYIKPAETSNIGPKLPKCPDPGLCIFWFLAQDLCAEDSHCHGALMCCMRGCSKICVDGENILS